MAMGKRKEKQQPLWVSFQELIGMVSKPLRATTEDLLLQHTDGSFEACDARLEIRLLLANLLILFLEFRQQRLK